MPRKPVEFDSWNIWWRTADHSESHKLLPLMDIAKKLGVSVPALREQMEVARAMGAWSKPAAHRHQAPALSLYPGLCGAAWPTPSPWIPDLLSKFCRPATQPRNGLLAHPCRIYLTYEDHQGFEILVAKALGKSCMAHPSRSPTRSIVPFTV